MPERLSACDFQTSYGPADDRLNRFYIPALSCSVRYDRTAGFFSSTALAVAAAGVARLVAAGGTMRLLVGAQLSEADVQAIEQGRALPDVVAERLVAALSEPQDSVMRRRLEVLAWLVASKRLEIRVVLPRDDRGRPLPAPQAEGYFHAKTGIFTDAYGDQVAFSGSVNESETAWLHNYEQFMVFRSWDATRPYVAEIAGQFERLWQGQEPGWAAIDVPEAARLRLLHFHPSAPPSRDPLEPPPRDVRREQVLCQFLRDAPRLAGARGLALATAPIVPWPHQAAIARRAIETYPEAYLFCDEVGLGKTIEAGLVLRQLYLSGLCRRCLILAPKSVCRQWQEELYEKFALDLPIYDGHFFRGRRGRQWLPETSNPWDGADLLIASSQLAKRRERQPELLSARPWDLVLVDEAHHARRRDLLSDEYRPNRLLTLLAGSDGRPGLKDLTKGLVLMTATPMQLHPVEVWDLLHLLGIGGRWGAGPDEFLRFFTELRRPLAEIDWGFIFDMLRDWLGPGADLEASFAALAEAAVGPVELYQLRALLSATDAGTRIKHLSPAARALLPELARRHTPLHRHLFRTTRRVLRRYAEQGLIHGKVPRRDPRPVWIAMRPEEQELYDQIEEYISHYYQKYEAERKGLGFIMTVYRRRLTSSFYAVQRSLERRLQGLLAILDDDDLEQDDLDADVGELLDEEQARRFQEEVAYVERFVAAIKQLGGIDSKVQRLLSDLNQIFAHRETVIIFTQYTDTMDFLRDQLCLVYGSQVACYSGRGGEVWHDGVWQPTTKEEIKNAFREGEAIKILVCTEAASEGLNLQTCGVLINYDMPWNPMRVEQRIGRIDRIGQVYDTVWVRHYFYEGTVEAQVYRALEDRIGWFEDVVGRLQPILGSVARTIQTVALAPAGQRSQLLTEALARLRQATPPPEAEALDMEQAPDLGAVQPVASPVTLAELERVLCDSATLGQYLRPHESLTRAYRLKVDGQDTAVTFDRQVFDAHPDTVRFVTYGTAELASLLAAVPPPPAAKSGVILRCTAEAPIPRCAYYRLDPEGRPRRVERLADVQDALESGPSHASGWTEAALAEARADFEGLVRAEAERIAEALADRRRAEHLALVAEGRNLLLRAALVELAMARQPDLFAQQALPVAFTSQAVTGLARHAYPFAPLLKLVDGYNLSPSPTDPFFLAMQGQGAAELKRQFANLKAQASRLVHRLASDVPAAQAGRPAPVAVQTTWL